jgi:hypothetical protein
MTDEKRHAVKHPDDLVVGRRYEFVTSDGVPKEAAFLGMFMVERRLYIATMRWSFLWKALQKPIKELEQT